MDTGDVNNPKGTYTSIAIGTDGNPVFSCTSGNTITTVDDPGVYTSIAIGTDGTRGELRLGPVRSPGSRAASPVT